MSGRRQKLYSQQKDESGLTKRQRQVLDMLTGEPRMTQLAVADELNVSRQRVRQIAEELMRKGHKLPGVKPPADVAP